MKDSFFLSNTFASDALGGDAFDLSVAGLLEAETEVFSDLVKFAGLDPETDLRYGNFDGIDLGGSDIRGFDFTGSSMKGVNWQGCVKDETTILIDIDLEELNEPFPPDFRLVSLMLKLNTMSANEQVIWLYSIRRNDPDHDLLLQAALNLFKTSNNPFVSKQALDVATFAMGPKAALEFIDDAIFRNPKDLALVDRAFGLLDLLVQRDRKRVLHFAINMLRTPLRHRAAIFLVKHVHGNDKKILNHLSDIIRDAGPVERRMFVSNLAMKFGEPFHFSIRNPDNGDMLDFGEEVSPILLTSIIRAIVRKKQKLELTDLEALKDYRRIYKNDFDQNYTRLAVLSNMRQMNEYGVRFRIPKK